MQIQRNERKGKQGIQGGDVESREGDKSEEIKVKWYAFIFCCVENRQYVAMVCVC